MIIYSNPWDHPIPIVGNSTKLPIFLESDQPDGSSHEPSVHLLGCSPLLPTLFYGGAYMATSSDERYVFQAYEQVPAIYTPFLKGKSYL